MVDSLLKWKRLEPTRRELMRAELERVASKEGLSKDVSEKAEKALG
jgi:aminopeptidase N